MATENRVTQVAGEVLETPGVTPRRVTQLAAEVLDANPNPPRRVTQLFAEVLIGTLSPVRTTAVWAEVLFFPNAAQVVNYETTVGTNDFESVDSPWLLGTTVGAEEDMIPGGPMELATTVSLLAWAAGDVPTDPGGGSTSTTTVTIQNQTAAGVTFQASAPTLLSYSNVTAAVPTETLSAPVEYETVTGARVRVVVRPDGRADVLDDNRYRR